jgi:hypothetical protein
VINFNFSSDATAIYPNPIDLDDWLNLRAISFQGKNYTHRQVIEALGNTMGAHVDRDIIPLVALLLGDFNAVQARPAPQLVQ